MPIVLTDRTTDMDFIGKIQEISGQNFKTCMQCGTCSTVCPVNESTDLTPRQMIHYLQFGLSDLVVGSNMAWMCASCYICELRCPRGLDIPRIVEAVRLLTLRTNKNYREPFEVEKELIDEMPQVALVSSFRKHTA